MIVNLEHPDLVINVKAVQHKNHTGYNHLRLSYLSQRYKTTRYQHEKSQRWIIKIQMEKRINWLWRLPTIADGTPRGRKQCVKRQTMNPGSIMQFQH